MSGYTYVCVSRHDRLCKPTHTYVSPFTYVCVILRMVYKIFFNLDSIAPLFLAKISANSSMRLPSEYNCFSWLSSSSVQGMYALA